MEKIISEMTWLELTQQIFHLLWLGEKDETRSVFTCLYPGDPDPSRILKSRDLRLLNLLSGMVPNS